jgi:hypothetical protein
MVQMDVVHNVRQGWQLQILERAKIEDANTWKLLIEDSITTILSITHFNDESDHLLMKPERVHLPSLITARGQLAGNNLDTPQPPAVG